MVLAFPQKTSLMHQQYINLITKKLHETSFNEN